MSGRLPRGVCAVCGREYALRWAYVALCWTMRRHGGFDICDGSGCEPARITLDYHEARRPRAPHKETTT